MAWERKKTFDISAEKNKWNYKKSSSKSLFKINYLWFSVGLILIISMILRALYLKSKHE